MKKTVKKAVSKKATVKRKAIHKKPVRGSYEAVMDAIEFAQKSGLAETYGR